MFAFMRASNSSRYRNGEIVTLDEALAQGQKEAAEILAKLPAK